MTPRVVGFTGTRRGMSGRQREQFSLWLTDWIWSAGKAQLQFHHGWAEGADAEADRFVVTFGHGSVEIHVHPCRKEGPPLLAARRVWYDVAGPLVRNRTIVSVCDVLVAAPLTDTEQRRSGTWATIRYARQAGREIVMLARGPSS